MIGIPADDFQALFENNRYFVVDYARRIAKYRIERKELQARMDELGAGVVSPPVLRKVRRRDPVSLAQATHVVKALGGLIRERDARVAELDPDEEVIGAFFVIEGLEDHMASRELKTAAQLTQAAGLERRCVDDLLLGRRGTLRVCLDVLRALNANSGSAGYLDPRVVIVSNPRVGKRAAARQCPTDAEPYSEWPARRLQDADKAP